MNTSSIFEAFLSYPIIIMIGIIAIAILALIILDKKEPIPQDLNLRWNIQDLDHLPHPSIIQIILLKPSL